MADEKKQGIAKFLGGASNKKLLIFSGVVIVAALVFSMFGFQKKEKPEISRLPSAAEAGGNVAGDKMSPEYIRIRDKKTSEDVAIAEHTGGSVTAPIRPVETDNFSSLSSLSDGLNEVAPTETKHQVTPPVTQSTQNTMPHAPLAQVKPNQPAEEKLYHSPTPPNEQQAQLAAQREAQLVQSMQQAMTHIAPTNPVKAEIISFQNTATAQPGQAGSNPHLGANSAGNGGQKLASADSGKGTSDTSTQNNTPGKHGRFQLPAPGTIFYSRILGEVNSDTPGPVLAEVLQGPFANARLIGTFKSTPNGLVLSFNTMTVPYTDEDGNPQTEVMSIQSVAVDTSHLGTAIASDINNHLLLNLGMAFGTSFLQGLGMAAQESGSYAAMGPYGTTVANPVLSAPGEAMMALGAGAATAGQIFQNIYGNKPPTIIINADTPFGLLFLTQNNN